MSKESAKKSLRIFSYLFLVFAGVTLAFGIVYLLNPDMGKDIISSKYNYTDLKDIKPEVFLFISYLFESLVYIWVCWLLRRVYTEKSKGILVLILLILAILGSVVSITSGFSISILLRLLIDAYLVFLIFKIRN